MWEEKGRLFSHGIKTNSNLLRLQCNLFTKRTVIVFHIGALIIYIFSWMNTGVVYKGRYAAISICHSSEDSLKRRQKACCRARPKVYVFKSHNPRCGYSFRFGLSFFFQSEILKKKEKHQACWIRLFGPIKTFQSRTRLFLSWTPHKRLSYGDSPLFVCLQISTAAYKMWNEAATVLMYLKCMLRIQEKNRNSFICSSVFIEVVYI